MINRSFFGLAKPRLKYPVVESYAQDGVKEIPLPRKVTLFLKGLNITGNDLILKRGDKVKTGQKLQLMEQGPDYLISPVTGNIASISEYTGYFREALTAISIDADEEDEWAPELIEAEEAPILKKSLDFLGSLPGKPDFASLLSAQPSVTTIVINGVDQDLFVTKNQLIVETQIERLKEGIRLLKDIIPGAKALIAVSPPLSSQAVNTGVEVKVVKPSYPDTLPKIIVKNLVGKEVAQGKTCEETGVGFMSAEAVVALALAFSEGKLPVTKMLTVIGKDNSAVNVRARIGTPVGDILKALGIETGHGDALVLGGPMAGQAIYSEDTPILYDTDALMVQDKEQIVRSSDTHCVNCGECVRACPARVPANMLIRLLENGLYEEAVEQYDLLSCIECGLCSYVCIAQIPVFHYIMLGKYEFAQIKRAEGANV